MMIRTAETSYRKHVLIIDDEKSLSQMLTMLLETRGYDVEVVTSGQEALSKVSSQVDLILLDLILPDIDGFEICRRLKRREATRHIPIIIISAQDVNENKVEGLYLGADDFLAKPCNIEELIARMEAVWRRGDFTSARRLPNYEHEVIIELRKILDQELIVPFFQPIYKLNPFELYGFEVLSRPAIDGKLASPEHFFKCALQFGLYHEMEMLCWSKAIDILSEQRIDKQIFLNCNPFLVEGAGLDKIKMIFEHSDIKPENVVLEITERSAISDFELFYHKMKYFRDYGFRFAVDDVGGGYASLETLVQTKPDVVKIDRHIISGLTDDAFKKSMVKFIVAFCSENNIEVIAEGIENPQVLQAAMDLGCGSGQGYYLYAPTPKIDLPRMQKINLP